MAVYATTARKANRCSRAVLLVACWDPAQVDKCRRIIAAGDPDLVFVPIVIDRDTAPPLADASPYLVLFNAVIGAVDPDTEQGRALAAAAITATGAEGKAEGIAEGEARGKARTRAEDILLILESRGLSPTRAERELIESCDDLGQLGTWFARALTVMTVAMVFED